MIDVPAEDPELTKFIQGWSTTGKGNPRAALGV
jgi:hypothetical protein